MIFRLMIAILCLFSSHLAGQEKNKNKFDVLYDSAIRIKDRNVAGALELVSELELLSGRSEIPNERIRLLYLKGILNRFVNRRLGLSYINEAFQIAKQMDVHHLDGQLLFAKGVLLKEINPDSANQYFIQSYQAAQKNHDSITMSDDLRNMSFIAMEKGNFVGALHYLESCESLFRKRKDLSRLINNRINQSHALSAVGLEDNAIKLANNAIDKARREQYQGYEEDLVSLYGNLIESLLEIKEPIKAYAAWKKMVKQNPAVCQTSSYSVFKLTLGDVFLALDSPGVALKIFKSIEMNPEFEYWNYRRRDGIFRSYKGLGDQQMERVAALDLVKQVPFLNGVKSRMDAFQIAQNAYLSLNLIDSAYRYQQLFFENYQQLYSPKQLAGILNNEFDTKLANEKKTAEIQRKSMESEINFNKQRFLFLVAVTILFALIIALLIKQYRSVKNFNAILNKKVTERTLELSEKNKQLSEYAFINAHKLRGPLARIMGLTQLVSNEKQSGEAFKLISMLEKESHSLDTIVRSITKAIEEKQSFDREDIKT